MSKIKIMCTSTGCIEYAPKRYSELGIEIIRVHVIYGGKEYKEGLDLDPVAFYEYLETIPDPKKNLPSTAMPDTEDIRAAFEKAIADGYDEAIVYYYEMNVDSDEAKAAVAIFEAFAEELAAQELASAMFLGYAEQLKSAKNDKDTYLALVNCAAYVDGVTDSIDGVAAALELYETELAKYNAKIAPMNGEIEQINDVVSAVRSGSIASAILAVINNIFNR